MTSGIVTLRGTTPEVAKISAADQDPLETISCKVTREAETLKKSEQTMEVQAVTDHELEKIVDIEGEETEADDLLRREAQKNS